MGFPRGGADVVLPRPRGRELTVAGSKKSTAPNDLEPLFLRVPAVSVSENPKSQLVTQCEVAVLVEVFGLAHQINNLLEIRDFCFRTLLDPVFANGGVGSRCNAHA